MSTVSVTLVAQPNEVTIVAQPVVTRVVLSETGPQGADGPQGPQGDPGPAGVGVQYTHTQNTPAAVWTIVHGLGRPPFGVRAVDSAGTEWLVQSQDLDVNTTRLTFGFATSGKAYVS